MIANIFKTAVYHHRKKTWIALPFVSDWRWFRDEKKSVWYENVTLYKQKQIGNWEEVFKSIRKDLEKNFMQG